MDEGRLRTVGLGWRDGPARLRVSLWLLGHRPVGRCYLHAGSVHL